jgi:hypothetical protein
VQVTLAVAIAISGGAPVGDSERLATRDDLDLAHGISAGLEHPQRGMPGFVVRERPPFANDNLLSRLESEGAVVSAEPVSSSSGLLLALLGGALPTLLLVGFWIWLIHRYWGQMSQGGGMFSMGRSKAHKHEASTHSPGWGGACRLLRRGRVASIGLVGLTGCLRHCSFLRREVGVRQRVRQSGDASSRISGDCAQAGSGVGCARRGARTSITRFA